MQRFRLSRLVPASPYGGCACVAVIGSDAGAGGALYICNFYMHICLFSYQFRALLLLNERSMLRACSACTHKPALQRCYVWRHKEMKGKAIDLQALAISALSHIELSSCQTDTDHTRDHTTKKALTELTVSA